MTTSADTTDISALPLFATTARPALIICSILGLLTLALYVTSLQYGPTLARGAHSDDPARLEIIMGNDVLSIPTNMIRLPEQRQTGVTKALELYLHWPTKSGYTHELAPHFNNYDPDTAQLIFVTLRQRATLLDMRDRFDPIYRKALKSQQKQILGGLTVTGLQSELGYIDEVLVHAPTDALGKPSFVARCLQGKEGSLLLANCETDIFVGRTLEMRVRFPDQLLRDWPSLQSGFEAIAESLIEGPARTQ